MDRWRERMESGSEILRQRAVRMPLTDREAERTFHENMARLADGGVRKSELLDDPNVPLPDVYEDELAAIRRSFEHRLQQVAGENYDTVATAYLNGERDDWIGALAAYYLESYYRLQELYTVDEQIFFLVILRYPDSFTVNFSFLTGDVSSVAVRCESTAHVAAELDGDDQEQLYADCQYSQHKVAEYLRESVDRMRDEFPDPETTPFEQRKYGGIVNVTGRNGPQFAEVLDTLSPDPDRFDDTVSEPTLVPEGPEAEDAKEELLTDAEVVL
ncbi:hypothetical protein GJ629_05480 [Halapricum sp. CBA1109]|nr:hypothetical protein [Halapricum sp. CBA1109]